MSKVAVSLLISFLVGVGALAGVSLHKSNQADTALMTLTREIASLSHSLDESTTALHSVQERLDQVLSERPAAAGGERASGVVSIQPAVAGGEAASDAPAQAVGADQIKAYVLAAIEEDRRLQGEERDKQREEMRQRFTQRREEMAQMREGPYGDMNLKVNSLASVLEMDDSQKQAYYELSKLCNEKLQKAREAIRAQAAAAGQTEEQGGQRGRGRPGRGGDREKYREANDAVQKEFETAVAAIFTPAQLETYNTLSGSAKSFQSQSYVAAPGDNLGRMFGGRGMGFSMMGGRTGRGGGRGGR